MSEEEPTPREEPPAPIRPPIEVPANPPEGQPDFSRPPPPAQYHQPYPGQQSYGVVDRIIPTKNVKALLAYYFGVFSFVPCFTPFLAPAALVLGILGLNECKRDPNLPGKGHAITGIVLGSITLLLAVFVVVFVLLNAKAS
jgi:hypothetical protein